MSKPWAERSAWLGRNVLPHEPELRSWLRGRRISPEDIEDVIQETYSRLLMADSVAHIRSPRTYAFQIAGSILIDYLRRLKVVPISSVSNLDHLQVVSDFPSPETEAIGRDELDRLGRAISALPARMQEVFRLRRIDGLSQREVAEKIGISESTVEKHMARGFLIMSEQYGHGGKVPSHPSNSRPVKAGQTKMER